MKIYKIKDQKEGSAIITYQINDREIKCLKFAAEKQKKRFSKKFINSCILRAITERIKYEEKIAGPTI
jgi:hypothetical protein